MAVDPIHNKLRRSCHGKFCELVNEVLVSQYIELKRLNLDGAFACLISVLTSAIISPKGKNHLVPP